MMAGCAQCEVYARRLTQTTTELQNSEEERDFVKTLWRQVQSDNPEMGVMVNTVLDKVAVQNEARDNHLLSILHDKDREILSLREEVDWLRSSVDSEQKERAELLAEWEGKQDDLNELISQLEEDLAARNLELSDFRRKNPELLAEKLDRRSTSLEKQLEQMGRDLGECGSQMASLRQRYQGQCEEAERLRGVVSARDTEIHSQQVIIAELKDSLLERRGDMGAVKERLEVAERDLSKALAELDKTEAAVRHSEGQLVEQGRSAHKMEKAYQSAVEKMKESAASLQEKVEALQESEKALRSENEALASRECRSCAKHVTTLASRDRQLSEQAAQVELLGAVRAQCEGYLKRKLAAADVPAVIEIMLGDLEAGAADLARTNVLVGELRGAARDRESALAKIQRVHDKRLDRMGILQEHLSEVLGELKILDQDRWEELRGEVETSPAPLTQEDGPNLWQDLQHYRGRCGALTAKLASAEEENDRLRVGHVNLQNNINEMKTAVLLDQAEWEERVRTVSHQSVCGCNLQLEMMRDKMNELKRESEKLSTENIQLLSAVKAAKAAAAAAEREHSETASQTTCNPLATVATTTDTAVGESERPARFTNTMTLLDRMANSENIPPPPSRRQEDPVSKRKKSTRVRCAGTQTLSQPPVKVLKKAPAALKIRMASLNQQVAVLTKAKHKYAKEVSEEAGKTQRAENQLSGVLRQLNSAQTLIAGLNEDVRVLTEERTALQDQIAELERGELRQSELATLRERGEEVRQLTHQKNLLKTQLTSSNATVKNLEKELEGQGVEVMRLQERLTRLERTTKQQHADNDTLRQELSRARATSADLEGRTVELGRKVKKATDVSENRRNYIEGLKAQLAKAKEGLEEVKSRYEECKAGLEIKTREVKEMGKRQEQQNKALSELKVHVARSEEGNVRQFTSLEQSYTKKIAVLNKRNLEWEKCVRAAIGRIVDKIKQEKKRRTVESDLGREEYDRAKHLSSSLLHLSEADFHDIMSSTRLQNNTSQDSNASVWKGQLAKILALDEFGPTLANSLVQLFDDFAKTLTGAAISSSEYDGSCETTSLLE